MESAPPSVSFLQVLRNRRFFALWLAQFVSTFGDWLALLALFSLVAFRFHGTSYQVAGIFVALFIPLAFLGPVAGVFVDRWNVKRTMIGSDLIRAVIAALLAFAFGLPQIYLLLFALSAVSCFFLPAQNVAIPLLVSKEELLVANSLNAQTFQFNKILSPAIAGLLVAWAGEKACFYVDSLTFVFSAAMLSLIPMARQPASSAGGVRSILRDLAGGLKFLAKSRALFFVTLAMMATLFALGAFNALTAVYVRDILHSAAKLFGGLISLSGVGVIAGALLIGKFGQQRSKVDLVLAGMLVLAVGIFALAAVGRPALALVVYVELGLGVSAVLIPSQTLIQEETPKPILGRVSSASMSVMTASQLIGVALAGKIADWIGIRNLYFAISFGLFLMAFAGYLYARVNRVPEANMPGAPGLL